MFWLCHAVGADHIAAIDNVVHKLMQDGQRPKTVGLWFSLGHSTIVVLGSLAIAATATAITPISCATGPHSLQMALDSCADPLNQLGAIYGHDRSVLQHVAAEHEAGDLHHDHRQSRLLSIVGQHTRNRWRGLLLDDLRQAPPRGFVRSRGTQQRGQLIARVPSLQDVPDQRFAALLVRQGSEIGHAEVDGRCGGEQVFLAAVIAQNHRRIDLRRGPHRPDRRALVAVLGEEPPCLREDAITGRLGAERF